MALAPQTLFHFTESFEGLKDILSSNFKLSYAKEHIYGLTEELVIRTPMVSFCDLRMSEIKDHIGNYGNYGIGMKKSWAIKNNLNPVLYLSNKSQISEYILKLINEFPAVKQSAHENTILSKYIVQATEISGYIKNYSGPLERKGKIISENYIFADEREWRYKLPFEKVLEEFTNNNFIGFTTDMITTKEQLNQRVNHIRLEFEPEDISYIIVNDDKELVPLINHIKVVKGDGFTANVVSRLQSRIITVEQIMKDF